MAYSDYTAPLFGDRDMKGFSFPALGSEGKYITTRNRADAVKTDKEGKTLEADILIDYTTHIISGSQAVSAYNTETQLTIKSDSAGCILAVPCNYGGRSELNREETYANMVFLPFNFGDIRSFRYFYITKRGNAPIKQYNNHKLQNLWLYSVGQATHYKTDVAIEWGLTPDIIDSNRTIINPGQVLTQTSRFNANEIIGSPSDLITRLQKINNSNAISSPEQIPNKFDKQILLKMTTLNAEWAARTDSLFNEIIVYVLGVETFTTKWNECPVGSTIATGFPIFTVDGYSQMIRYFQGQSYVSDNDPTPPPSDWSTDWDVWVRGANKPNIYVTMKSDKVDEWLSSTDNKSGIKKSDIKVEWRIREYPLLNNNYNLKNWKKTNYDTALQSSYMEIAQLSHPESDTDPDNDPLYIPGNPPDALQEYYAEWEFRLNWNTYTSTWCYAKVGVIGSPSVPDFANMRNVGEQTDYGFNDSSTVTLHYDEYPPGYDPYPTPPKPSDPGIIGGDTLPTTPTDSALGLGLLTTTYLLTASQAEELGSFIWNFDLFEKIKALNTSPLDNIVSLKIIPYAVSGSPAEIVIGNVSTQINADKVGALPLLKVGELEYQGRYQNFLDVTGDTTAHLFLPFIGFVPIDPIWFTNKKIEVYYAFDAITGTCRAIIAVDRISVANYTSSCGIDIPMSMGSRAQQEAAYVGASLGVMLAAAGAPTAGLTTAVGSIASVAFGDNKNQRTGGVSPMTAQYETRMCYIVIESTNANYPRSSAHDFGMPCNSSYSLAQLSGFTQTCDNPDLSGIGCSEEEKEMIRQLLTSGIYL